jgi:ubiquitin-protein ligase E3 B
MLRAQTVISGKNCGDWDVDDLAAHAKFEQCSASHSTVVKLLKVLREFSPQQRSLFLKFVTSCPRPPLLGFSELQVQRAVQAFAAVSCSCSYPPPQPPICIYLIPGERGFFSFRDEDRLPSASTCFNLLKLPPYKSSKASACAAF